MARKRLNARKFDPEQGQWHSVDQKTIQELSSTGRHQECLEACQQLLQSEPEHPLPWKYAGKSLLALGQFEKAQQCLAKAHQLDTRDPETIKVLDSLESIGYSIHRQINQGLPAARNTGARITDSEFLLFLDDDNRLLAPYFNQGIELLQKYNTIDVVYGNKRLFGDKSGDIRVGIVTSNQLWEKNSIDNCALIRRSFINRCGGYSQLLSGLGFEDWELWLKGINSQERLKMAYLDETCFEYRVRHNSMLQNLLSSKEKLTSALATLRSLHGPRVGARGAESS